MRRVIIQGTPPADWVADAEAVTLQLRAAANPAERADIIKDKEGLWRDDRIRNWLLQQFANKCWYTEAYDSVSSIHVDHYRPKGRAKDLGGNEREGYWWLAFDWNNYRICGQLINVKKSDIFPIIEGAPAQCSDPVSLKLEAPMLIDPLTDETRLISFEKDEASCLAVPAAGIDDVEELRATTTIEVLGLNRPTRLNAKRAKCWDECLLQIAKYRGAKGKGAQALCLAEKASVLSRLKEMVTYTAEFSAVAEACIRKNAPEALVASVFDYSQPCGNPT